MMNYMNYRKIVREKEIFYIEVDLNSEAQSRLLTSEDFARKGKSLSTLADRKALLGRKK